VWQAIQDGVRADAAQTLDAAALAHFATLRQQSLLY
jgi:hypothetical protein